VTLRAIDLTNKRATLEASLPDTCAIQRPSSVSDGQGGDTVTYPDLANGVARLSGVAARADAK
jgi:hypothetical protein